MNGIEQVGRQVTICDLCYVKDGALRKKKLIPVENGIFLGFGVVSVWNDEIETFTPETGAIVEYRDGSVRMIELEHILFTNEPGEKDET